MNSYAKVWDVQPGKGNFTKVRLSVSKKDKQTGEYVQDFSGFCMFIGDAHTKAATLKAGDRIKLGDIDVSTTYDKQANKEYVNYKVFSYEQESAQPQQAASVDSGEHFTPVEGDDEMPF